MFSDILTPLSGMNIPFDIVKGKGPVIFDPIHTAGNVDQVRQFVPEESVPYVGEALTILRKEVDVFKNFFPIGNALFCSLSSIVSFITKAFQCCSQKKKKRRKRKGKRQRHFSFIYIDTISLDPNIISTVPHSCFPFTR